LITLLFNSLNFSATEEFYTGAVYVHTDMALVFCSRPLMDSFANARHIFLDGTFQTVPTGFVGTDPGPAKEVPRTTKRGRQVKPRRRLVEED
jgi:hypothetical protein